MAWITKEKTAKGETRYLVGWREPCNPEKHRDKRYHPEGDRIHKSFRLKADADRHKRLVEDQLDRDTYVSSDDRKRTLGDYFDAHLTGDTELRGSTAYGKRLMFDKHVRPIIGNTPVASIRRQDVADVLSKIEGPSARAKVRNGVLSPLLKQAVQDGLLAKNPMIGVKSVKQRPQKRRLVSQDELNRILAAADERYRLPLAVAAAAGLRGGEVGGLRVGDVNFQRHTISIRQAITRDSKAVIGLPKTDEAERTIRVNELTDWIADYIEEFPPAPDGRIFHTNSGRDGLMSSTLLGYAYRRACERVGITPESDPEGLGRVPELHGLRHFCASRLIQAGKNIKQIQKFLGHAKAAETLDVYADLFPDDLDECATVVSEVVTGYRTRQAALPATIAG